MWKCETCHKEFDDVRVQNERLNKEPTTFADFGLEPPQKTSAPECLKDDCPGALRRMPDPPTIPQVKV